MASTFKEPLERLADYFAPEDLQAFPLATSKKTNKGLAAYYVDNRAIMDRLDSVVGPTNWRNEFKAGPDGGVVCGLSIYDADKNEWVTKWDGAENTDIEPVKGGLSTAMRRAAVQWGIGRYLYHVEGKWLPLDERGKRFLQDPISVFPKEFLPKGSKTRKTKAAPSTQTKEDRPAESRTDGNALMSAAARQKMVVYAKEQGVSLARLEEILLEDIGLDSISEIPKSAQKDILEAIKNAA